MSKTITIDEDKFIDILGSTGAKFCKTELDILKFAIFCGEVHTALFGDDEDTEAPFKEGDEVFVIDNKNDHNCFVNQVVTIINVGENLCDVTNGDTKQTIYFKNLRKVVN